MAPSSYLARFSEPSDLTAPDNAMVAGRSALVQNQMTLSGMAGRFIGPGQDRNAGQVA